MSIAVITGSAGLIGSEASAFFAGVGLDVVGIDNDMRKTFFGEEASTSWNRARLEEQLGRQYRHVSLDIRDTNAIRPSLLRSGRSGEADRPCGRAALSRLGGTRASHRLSGQCGRDAEPPGGNARQYCAGGGRSSLLRRTRSTETFPIGCRSSSSRNAVRDRPGPSVCGRDSRGDEHRSVDAQPVRCVQSRGRRARAGVRPLLRPADGLFSRRVSDRARTTPAHSCTGSCRTSMKCAMTGTPYTRVRIQGQAGPRQHPQRRPDCGVRTVLSCSLAPARSTTSAAAASATARSSRRSRSARS